MALTPKQALVLAQGYTNTSIEGTTGPLAGKNCTIESQTYANGRNTIVFKWTADNGDVRRTTIVVRDGTPIYEWTSGDNYQYGDLVIYASCFYRCITPNHDVEFDATKWNEIGSPDGNYDLVETKTLLPSIFTSADRKMYFVIDEGLFYLWDGIKWTKQTTKWNDITGKPEFAGVATSGSYNDLSNKPNIPANTSDLTNDSDFVSDVNYVHTDNNYDDTAKNIVDGVTSALNDKVDKVENKGLSTNDYTDTDKAIVTGVTDALTGKVDKVQGKGLSTNDYDNTAKSIVDGVTNALNGKVDKNGTDSLMTADEHTKLAGIAAGAEVNVQSDWNQTNQDADDFIKNKPNIPAAQVNADWEANSGVAEILHKPTIPAAQVNSDWEASSGVAEILNKPTLGTAAAKNVPSTGNASTTQVVMGDDTRLTDSRPASDVSAWAKESTKPTYTASEVGAIASIEKGSNSGVAELDANGKVPSSQLPGFVDDVVEGYYKAADDRFYEESTFETLITPISGKSWVDISTNKSYRWTGSVYVRVDEGVQLGETSDTAYRGDRGKTAYDFSQNPATATPSMDGTGAIGSSGKWAREDHVHPKDTTKADKVSSAISGNFAGLDSNGNLTDSGKKPSDFVTDVSGKADKVSSATNNNFAALDANGNLKDSGHKHSDYLTQHQDISGKADKVSGATSGNVATLDANGNLVDSNKTLGKSVPSDAVFTDTNTKVTQTNTTGSADYRLVLSTNANDTTETNTARKSTNFKANPSTGVLSTPKVKISKSANALITGSGTAGSDKGSGVSPRYYPAKWTFNLGGNPDDGDIITIKIPVAGGTYSEWLSTDNGTTYHPIALNGKSRITSQYAVNTYLTLIYESSGVCTTYALAGADSTADVTGTWRVINYYDSNTTYSNMSQTEADTGTATTGRLMTAKVLSDTISNKISNKADKAVPSASGNIASLDSNGNLADSGKTLGKSVPSNAMFTDSGHTILNGSGSAMTQRGKLQILGAKVSDDSVNNKTIIETIAEAIIGSEYSDVNAYYVRDYCIKSNVLYKCIQYKPANQQSPPPNSSYWVPTDIMTELKSNKLYRVSITVSTPYPNDTRCQSSVIDPSTGIETFTGASLSSFTKEFYLPAGTEIRFGTSFKTSSGSNYWEIRDSAYNGSAQTYLLWKDGTTATTNKSNKNYFVLTVPSHDIVLEFCNPANHNWNYRLMRLHNNGQSTDNVYIDAVT